MKRDELTMLLPQKVLFCILHETIDYAMIFKMKTVLSLKGMHIHQQFKK